MARITLMFLIALCFSVVAAGQTTHAIQDLLRDAGGTVPIRHDVVATLTKAGALEATEAFLSDVREQDFWPGAIEVIGMVADTDDIQAVFTRLNEFMHSKEPYGCESKPRTGKSFPGGVLVATALKKDCPPLQFDQDTEERDREARLAVPAAMGRLVETMILRNGLSDSASRKTMLAIVASLEALASIRTDVVMAYWCPDDTCRLELQLNAVKGLKLSSTKEAQQSLHKISVQGRTASIVSAAQDARGVSAKLPLYVPR